MIKNRLNSKLVRYLIAGGVSYIVEIGSILLLVRLFGFSDLAAVAIAFWLGLVTSFGLQKLFVFSSKTSTKKTFGQLLLYLALVAINYGFTLGFVALLSPTIHVTIARTIALIITTAWNFVAYNTLIFKPKEDSRNSS